MVIGVRAVRPPLGTLAWQGEQRDALWEELKTFLPTAGGKEKAAELAAEPATADAAAGQSPAPAL